MEAIILLGIIFILGMLPGFIQDNSFTLNFSFSSTTKTLVFSAGILIIILLIEQVLIKTNVIENNNNFIQDKLLVFIKKYSIVTGITILSMYAFVSIANGSVTMKDVIEGLKNVQAVVAVIIGVLMTQFAKHGITFMEEEPDLLIMIVVGIIFGVIAFDGVATGPLIGSGIAVMVFAIMDSLVKFIN